MLRKTDKPYAYHDRTYKFIRTVKMSISCCHLVQVLSQLRKKCPCKNRRQEVLTRMTQWTPEAKRSPSPSKLTTFIYSSKLNSPTSSPARVIGSSKNNSPARVIGSSKNNSPAKTMAAEEKRLLSEQTTPFVANHTTKMEEMLQPSSDLQEQKYTCTLTCQQEQVT